SPSEPSSSEVNVPDVTDMEQTEAEEALEEEGLTAGEITEEHSDEVDEGAVISQDPAADEGVEEGASVDLVISLGPEVEEVAVPDVTGMERDEAEEALEEAGLAVGLVPEEHSDEVEEGAVISQDPAAGETTQDGFSVDFVVSSGPEVEEVGVPDVTGTDQAEAEEALEEAGLTLGEVTEEPSDDVDEGAVISQDPAADETLEEGASVDVVISLGADEEDEEESENNGE
ncbi:MAG: PASTA domain-containing protein, partial [Candidatus Hydrogenedentota bacterium]